MVESRHAVDVDETAVFLAHNRPPETYCFVVLIGKVVAFHDGVVPRAGDRRDKAHGHPVLRILLAMAGF